MLMYKSHPNRGLLYVSRLKHTTARTRRVTQDTCVKSNTKRITHDKTTVNLRVLYVGSASSHQISSQVGMLPE